jgi:hypothetical protein
VTCSYHFRPPEWKIALRVSNTILWLFLSLSKTVESQLVMDGYPSINPNPVSIEEAIDAVIRNGLTKRTTTDPILFVKLCKV